METKTRNRTLAAQHKRIVVNLKTGQTVNLGKRFGVCYTPHGSIWKAFYDEQSCKNAIRDFDWIWRLCRKAGPSGFVEPYIKTMDFSRILDQNGELLPGWVEVNDPAYPHKEIGFLTYKQIKAQKQIHHENPQ